MNYDVREKRSGPLTEDRVSLMIKDAVGKALESHEQQLMRHMDDQFTELKQTFAAAFPNGDPHGHRIAHEKIIASSGKWDAIKRGVIEKIIFGGIWAAIVFGVLAVWDAVKREIGK